MDDCVFSAAQGDFRELGGGVRRRVRSYNGAIMGVEVDFDEGGVGAPHTHPHAQLTYCLSGEMTGLSSAEKAVLQSIITANGRSYSDPVYAADGTVDKEASRRVVFKFRMKDSEMIDQMSEILEGQQED